MAVNVTEESLLEDEVIIIKREPSPTPSGPPPYPTPSPYQDEHSEDPPPLTVPERTCGMLLRRRMLTNSPISRVFRDIRQRQAPTIQHNRPPGPKCVIPLPLAVEYKHPLPHIITTSCLCLRVPSVSTG